MSKVALSLGLVVSAFALAACADTTAPTNRQAVKQAPTKVSATRYILASGATPPPGCTDAGNGWWECS